MNAEKALAPVIKLLKKNSKVINLVLIAFTTLLLLPIDFFLKHNVVKDSMPTMILVLSDMQFDESQRGGWEPDMTHFGHMKKEYESKKINGIGWRPWRLCSSIFRIRQGYGCHSR